MCRRAQGAGFVTWVGVAADGFRLEAGADVLSRYRSSATATRSFCRLCGSPLFFESAHWPGEIHVTLASLDSSAGLEPTAHAYWNSRADWAHWGGADLAKVEPGEHGS